MSTGPSPASLKAAIESRYLPTVLVLSTDAVSLACRKNGIELVSLLRPFTSLPRDVHVRTTGDLYPVSDFRVRLVDFGGLITLGDAPMKQWFSQMAKDEFDINSEAGQTRMRDVEGTLEMLAERCGPEKPEISENKMAKMVNELASPLMDRFQHDYSHACRFSCFDTYDHPVACILAASAGSSDVVAELKGLFTSQISVFSGAAVDNFQFMYYVLVYDVDAGVPQAQVDRSFSDMKTIFGPQSCKLLQINGNNTGTPQVNPAMWMQKPSIDVPQPLVKPEEVCIRISTPDEASLKTLMYDFMERGLLPHLMRRIKLLDQQVSEKRQGKIGKMMSYFLGNKGNDNPSNRQAKGGPHFSPDSCEMQMRKLADLCLFLRDYDSALSMYKNLKSELSSQDSKHQHLYHAGACEGMGLCMVVQQKRDADQHLDQAAQLYLRGNRGDYSLRARLTQYSLARVARSYRASEIMRTAINIDDKNTLHAGLFYEAAAISFLYSNYAGSVISRVRKFAFNMTLAGLRYSASDCVDQALRVTLMATAVYSQLHLEEWVPINEHLQLTIARLWAHKHQAAKSVLHMGQFLVAAQRTEFPRVKEYSERLQQFLQEGATGPLPPYDDLPLPIIATKSVVVFPEPHQEQWFGDAKYKDPTLAQHCELNREGVAKEWESMENDLLNAVRSEFKNVKFHPTVERQKAERARKKSRTKSEEPDFAVITRGEAVVTHITMSNPLSIPVEVSDVALLFAVTDDQPAAMAAVNPPDPETDVLRGHTAETLVLSPGESRQVELRFTCEREGWARLLGVVRTVSAEGLAAVDGRFWFYKTAAQDTAAVLTMQCVGAFPLLQCSLIDPPSVLRVDGQVSLSSLRLKNIGGQTMTRIALKMSPANLHLAHIDFSATSTKGKRLDVDEQPSFQPIAVKEATCESQVGTLSVPDVYYMKDLVIAPGESVDLPLWVRSETGSNSKATAVNYIPFVFSYSALPEGDAQSPTAAVMARFCKMVVRSIVLPGVSVHSLCLPPSAVRPVTEDEDVPEFIVSLEVLSAMGSVRLTPPAENAGVGAVYNHALHRRPVPLTIEQVSFASSDWEVTPLDPEALRFPCTIYPNSAVSMPLRVKRRKGVPGPPGATCFTSKQPQYEEKDTTSQPYANFMEGCLRDMEKGTGGAGGVGLPPVLKDGSGMSMFLDRKEKKHLEAFGVLAAAAAAEEEAVKERVESYPIGFSVFWSVGWDASYSKEGGTKVYKASGQAVECTLPAAATLKHSKKKWQDQSMNKVNLLQKRGVTNPEEVTRSPNIENFIQTVSEPQLASAVTPSLSVRGAVPSVNPDANKINMVGISVVAPSVKPFNFTKAFPSCKVDVSITLVNHYNSERELWLSLSPFKSLNVIHGAGQYSSQGRAAPPPPAQGKAPVQGAQKSGGPPPMSKAAPPPPQRSASIKSPSPKGTPPPSQQHAKVMAFPSFVWEGKTKHKVKVGAFQNVTLQATARFHRPGVYNLNQLEVTVSSDDNVVIQGNNDSDGLWLISVEHDASIPEEEEKQESAFSIPRVREESVEVPFSPVSLQEIAIDDTEVSAESAQVTDPTHTPRVGSEEPSTEVPNTSGLEDECDEEVDVGDDEGFASQQVDDAVPPSTDTTPTVSPAAATAPGARVLKSALLQGAPMDDPVEESASHTSGSHTSPSESPEQSVVQGDGGAEAQTEVEVEAQAVHENIENVPTPEPVAVESAEAQPSEEHEEFVSAAPTTAEPATEEPVSAEQATEEPVTEEQPTEEPATEEPATEEPAEEPTTEDPATEEQLTEEPMTEEPTTEEQPTEEREEVSAHTGNDEAVSAEPESTEQPTEEAPQEETHEDPEASVPEQQAIPDTDKE